MNAPHHLRIFLASPGDTERERNTARHLVDQLNDRYKSDGRIVQLIAWDVLRPPLPADSPPQQGIAEEMPWPSECDLVLVLFGYRFGMPPGKIRDRAGKLLLRADGSEFLSGTEFELWDALEGHRKNGTGRPIVLVYRRKGSPQFDGADSHLGENVEQWQRLQKFFEENRLPEDTVKPSFNMYDVDDLEALLRGHLEKLVPRLFQMKEPTFNKREPALPLPSRRLPVPGGASLAGDIDDESLAKLLRAYLDWLILQHRSLELTGYGHVSGVASVELERVYVALRADRTSSHELGKARELLDLDGLERFGPLEGLSPDEQRQLFADVLQLTDSSTSFRRHRLIGRTITLGEAVQRERWLMILGDPGSGKTTLARWLVLKLSRALLADETGPPVWREIPAGQAAARLVVPAQQVNPETPEDQTPVDLGPVRLPVLVRMADYVTRLRDEQAQERSFSLIDYLGHHPWLGSMVPGIDPRQLNSLIRRCLAAGRAVIILDGLDEIPEASDRRAIVQEVKIFRHYWVNFAGRPAVSQLSPWESLFQGEPQVVGGNQLLLTSRIAGYRAAPLEATTHVTIQPMRRTAVEHFCALWMEAVHVALAEADSLGLVPAGQLATLKARSAAEAQGLIEAIYGHRHRGVQELATNPLLVTILALVYREQGQSLPQQRAGLYQSALQLLVREWRRTSLDPEEVVYVLAPLAAHMQDYCANGLISERELSALISRPLAECRPVALPYQREEIQHAFLQDLREKVGLLAARGDRLYSFLHLTFQEFLAARYLLGPSAAGLGQFSSRLGDPRWREPLQLALGYASWKGLNDELEGLVETLLSADDPLGDLLPRGALFIVEALPDLKGVPAGAIRRILHRLLRAFAGLRDRAKLKLLQQRIGDALLLLRRHGVVEAMDEVLREAFSNPELAPAAAMLVREQSWLSAGIGATLAEAVSFDAAVWGWPITAILRELSSPPTPQAEPKEPIPLKASELLEVRENDAAEADRLELFYDTARRLYERHAVRKALAQRAPLAAAALGVRGLLESRPDLLEQVRSSPVWMSLLLALCGGFEDRKAHEIEREYVDHVHFLQKPEAARNVRMEEDPESYVGFGDFNDPIYAIAVYLDSGMAGRIAFAGEPPRFTPSAIYREPLLAETIRRCLLERSEPGALVPEFWQIWNGDAEPERKAEALLALAALGEEVHSSLAETLGIEDSREVGQSALREFARVAATLDDSICRARVPILKALGSLESEPERWVDVALTVLRVLHSHASTVFSSAALQERFAAAGHGAVLQADQWIQALTGEGDDPVEKAKVLLDTMPRDEALFSLLASAHAAPSHLYNRNALDWPLDPLPPRWRDDDPADLPIEVLAAFESLWIGHIRSDLQIRLREEILKRFCDRALAVPDLLPEILILAFPSLIFEIAPQVTDLLPRGFFRQPLAALADMAQKVANPYHRARALLRLLPYSAQLEIGRDLLVKNLLVSVRAIAEPHRRERLWELTIPVLEGEARSSLLPEVLETVWAIADLDERARASARLSFLVPTEAGAGLRQKAIEAARSISDSEQRAGTLRDLHATLQGFPDVGARLREAAQELSDRWLQAKAEDRLRSYLVGSPPLALRSAVAATPEVWAPVLLSAAIGEILDGFSSGNDEHGLWRSLIKAPQETIRHLLEEGVEDGWVLTLEAARSIQALLAGGWQAEVRALLPLLHSPTPQARVFVESWTHSQDRNLQQHAILFLAEDDRKLNLQTLPALVELLEAAVDRSRYRALLTLISDVWDVRKSSRNLRVSRLGAAVLEVVARHILRLRKSHSPAARDLRRMMGDIVHDDSKSLIGWCEIAGRGGDEAEEALLILANIEEIDDTAWSTFVGLLASTAPAAQSVLLTTLGVLAFLGKVTDGRWADVLPELRKLASQPVAADRYVVNPHQVVVATLSRLAQEKPPSESIGDAAEAHFASLGRCLSDVIDGGDKAVQGWVNDVGATEFTVYLDGSDQDAEASAEAIQETPELFAYLVRWLLDSLDIDEIEGVGTSRSRYILLTVTAAVAKRMPSDFALLARNTDLRTRLTKAARSHPILYGRRAALVLLGLLRQLNPDVVEALLEAMRGHTHLQRAALEAVTEFVEFEGDILTLLLSALHHESAMTTYGAARLLSLLGRHERSSSEQRRTILEALARGVKDSSSRRGVYQLMGYGRDQDDAVRIGCLGHLDEMLYQVLAEVAGVI